MAEQLTPQRDGPEGHSSDPGQPALFGMTPGQLEARLEQRGQRTYRSRQILEWAYQHGVQSFDEMTNLPKSLRAELAASMTLYTSQVAKQSESGDGTIKLLLRWPDTHTSECVLIPEGRRRTACISTQVGCPVGCVFCASGLGGLARNLTAAEIVEQAMRLGRLCEPDRLTNVVFMGVGEPLANYAATVAAVRIINASWGLGVAARKITVSTVGLPKQMRRLAEEGLQITLALSLHAPNDRLRRRLIPWARSVTIEELTAAARTYFDLTGREVTVEYVLLGGVNDQPVHARQLARLCGQMRSNVNLIPYNQVPSLRYQASADEDRLRFLDLLGERGVNAHLRRSRGSDIAAACGQLRREGGIEN